MKEINSLRALGINDAGLSFMPGLNRRFVTKGGKRSFAAFAKKLNPGTQTDIPNGRRRLLNRTDVSRVDLLRATIGAMSAGF